MTPSANSAEEVVSTSGTSKGSIRIKKYQGALWINRELDSTNQTKLEDYPLLTDGTAITLTFRYVAEENPNGELTGNGLITLTTKYIDSQSVEQTFTCSQDVNSTDEVKAITKFTNGQALLSTNNGKTTFTNITLTQLDNKLVPEPTTATLSLLALAGLAARRRRR